MVSLKFTFQTRTVIMSEFKLTIVMVIVVVVVKMERKAVLNWVIFQNF